MTYITQIYCENTHCNVRECEVITKDIGDNPEPEVWRCPACGEETTVHWRRDLAEHERIELGNAIGRVNAALYERDRKGLGTPFKVLALDQLPDLWKSVE